jgi:hypothetical protein
MEHGNTQSRYNEAYPAAIPDERPRDLEQQIKAVHVLRNRLDLVYSQVTGQIGRLYGEGDPPGTETQAKPSPVGQHYEMDLAIQSLEGVVSAIEAKVERLSRYA